MYETRKDAIRQIAARSPKDVTEHPSYDPADYGKDVFGVECMRQRLPEDVFNKLYRTMRDGSPIDPTIADTVAEAMKQWAIEKGATHFTHWFQPLTGQTAEKHDAFLHPNGNGYVIQKFSGKNLILGEPDASSFPSGGLRATFEARGYTAWDPTSPAFIRRQACGATLYIPTAFCSYTGVSLDKKTPLLKSIQALSNSVKEFMKCFGESGMEPVRITLGAEQEYFLIDRNFFLIRPDLAQTGRTLFGAPPPKHQQLDDHYFAAIQPRILSFMTDVEHELWNLGIPAKTRHNEAAPAQFELAPVFEEQNLACDHNMLIMEVLRQKADEHGFECLLHEKPFRGINGSGKHNNWSVDYGKLGLLNPGSDPHQNSIFLTMLCAVIQAVDRHSDLLCAATACAGNSHRLGAHEAPPAIISIYLGEQLSDVIAQIERGDLHSSRKAGVMRIGADALPPLPLDATDRNRTSPFAFTGNKFEFRAPGSSQSCAGPNMVLNTIVAESLDEVTARLKTFKKEDFNTSLQKLLKEIIRKHKRILFNGDNYTDEWKEEAKKRGLFIADSIPKALSALQNPENQELFTKYGVLNHAELESRHEVFAGEYERKVRIEAELSLSLARTLFIPAASKQLENLTRVLLRLKDCGLKAGKKAEGSMAERIGTLADSVSTAADLLEQAIESGNTEAMVSAMTDLRRYVDRLEKTVDDDLWPLPKYREMLFIS